MCDVCTARCPLRFRFSIVLCETCTDTLYADSTDSIIFSVSQANKYSVTNHCVLRKLSSYTCVWARSGSPDDAIPPPHASLQSDCLEQRPAQVEVGRHAYDEESFLRTDSSDLCAWVVVFADNPEVVSRESSCLGPEDDDWMHKIVGVSGEARASCRRLPVSGTDIHTSIFSSQYWADTMDTQRVTSHSTRNTLLAKCLNRCTQPCRTH